MADRSIPNSPPPNPTDPEQTFGNSKANLQIGVQSNQTNSFQDIGFGYVGAALQHKPPAVIAYEQTSDAGETNGDLVFGTRSTTDGSTAASRVMRIRASGAVEVDGDTTVSETLRVNKDVTLDADLVVTKGATAWTHSGGTSLVVTSTNGFVKVVSSSQYVDVESVRFTDDYIGIAGDTNIIRLTSTGSVATALLDGKLDVTDDVRIGDTSNPKLTVDASNGNTVINGTLDVNGNAVFEGEVLVKGFFHALGDYRIGDSAPSDSLTIKAATNQTGDMTLMDTLDVYGVATLYNNLVISGSKDFTMNTNKFKVTGSSGNVETLGSVTMHGVNSVLTHDGASGSLAISSSTGPVTIAGQSTGGYVDVESVRFTDNQIGTTTDADLITIADGAVTILGGLTTTTMSVTSTFGVTSDFTVNTDKFIVHSSNGNVTMKGDLEMEGDTATLTHSGSTGGLAISSAQHVDVESVRFTTNQIGSTGDADLITLVNDKMSLAGTLEMTVNSAALTHSGTTSLAISSTNGHITIAGGSGDYVDVESVRFTDDYIGISTDTDIIRLTSTGSQATVAMVADVDVTGTMDVSSDFAIGTTKFKVVESTGAVSMSSAAQTITHSGATSLTISSSQAAAFVKIEGGSSAYVDVESVRFTDNKIGMNTGNADLITLVNAKMSLAGALDLTVEDATITHTGSSGTPTLTISSTNGPVSLASTAAYVDVESVRFTGDQIGLSGDTAILQLTTSASVGNVAIDGTVTMIDDTTSLTHTGTTSLAISSTNGHITIAGGSDDYVDVESVRFTDNQIGINGDTDIITLTSGAAKVTGTLNVTAATQLDTTLGVTGAVTLADDVTMTKAAAALTHSGTTSLAISSTNGYVTIAGGSGDYVDVESVRFTDDYIGISTDTDIIRLTSTGSQATVAMVADVDVTGTMDVSSDFAIGTTKFKVVESTGAVSMSSAAQTITHSGATSLTISSSQAAAFVKIEGGSSAYVDVESVRFTDDYIGISTDTDIIRLTSTGSVATALLDGKLDVTDDVRIGDTSNPKLTVDASNGNTVINGTLDVNGNAVFEGEVLVKGFFHALGDYRIGDSAPSDSLTIKAATNQTGDMTLMDTLDVYGVATLYNNLVISGSKDFTMNTNKFKVTGSSGNVETLGSVTMHGVNSVLTHDGASGSLAISSSTGPVTIAGQSTGGYVDVESVRFTDNQIGINGDTDIITLTSGAAKVTGTLNVTAATQLDTTLGVTGAVTLADDVTMTKAAAALTHSGTTSLAISSTNGYVTIAGGSGDYVDVESVRFTDDYIGISTDTDIIRLTSTGSQATVAMVADVDVTGTMDVSSDFAIGTTKFKVVESTGAVSMSSAAQTITHSGATSLTISSSQAAAYVKIEGGSSAYVDVESVRFTDNKIGMNTGNADLITLVNAKMSLAGALDLTVEDATITHTGSSGTPTLTISSTNGPVSLASTAAYVDVESVRFTGDQIGLSGDTAILQLTTSASVGNVAIDGTVTMIDDTTSLTHTGTTSLAISSTNGHITIAGGSDDYVDVESVRFTDNQIGINGDTDIITLTSGAAKVTGTLNVTAATQLDTTLGVTGAVTLADDVTMTKAAAALTHSGTTSLAISSTNGYVTIAGGQVTTWMWSR